MGSGSSIYKVLSCPVQGCNESVAQGYCRRHICMYPTCKHPRAFQNIFAYDAEYCAVHRSIPFHNDTAAIMYRI